MGLTCTKKFRVNVHSAIGGCHLPSDCVSSLEVELGEPPHNNCDPACGHLVCPLPTHPRHDPPPSLPSLTPPHPLHTRVRIGWWRGEELEALRTKRIAVSLTPSLALVMVAVFSPLPFSLLSHFLSLFPVAILLWFRVTIARGSLLSWA